MASSQVHLQQPFDAVEALEDQLVARIELDAWFSVDTFGAKFCAELAFWLGTVAARFARATNLALEELERDVIGKEKKEKEEKKTYCNSCSSSWVIDAAAGFCVAPLQWVDAVVAGIVGHHGVAVELDVD